MITQGSQELQIGSRESPLSHDPGAKERITGVDLTKLATTPMRHLKNFVLEFLFGRWRTAGTLADGYSILLPMPMDMPFLLWFALEGLREMDTTHCNQVVVIPDGWGSDGGQTMERVIQSFDDPRIVLSRLPRTVDLFIHKFQRPRSHIMAANWLHWAMIVEGTNCANSKHAFLHDADAFFIERDSLELQYAECRDRGMLTLGVENRADAFFLANAYTIPGTWEMMYSVPWAISRSALALKGNWRDTPHGPYEFDTMLHAQYLDYTTGKVGVMASPPQLVHFHATISTYRAYIDPKNVLVADDLFRLLLLSMLEELVPESARTSILPAPGELARGLDDPTALIRYDSPRAAGEFRHFRRQINEILLAPVFAGERAAQIREYVRPFDNYFATRALRLHPTKTSLRNPDGTG